MGIKAGRTNIVPGSSPNIYYCTILSGAFLPSLFFFLLDQNHDCWVYMVVVHYRAWAEKSQHKFEDTWQEQRPIEMVLGKGMPLMEV